MCTSKSKPEGQLWTLGDSEPRLTGEAGRGLREITRCELKPVVKNKVHLKTKTLHVTCPVDFLYHYKAAVSQRQ